MAFQELLNVHSLKHVEQKAFDGGVSHRGFPGCVDCRAVLKAGDATNLGHAQSTLRLLVRTWCILALLFRVQRSVSGALVRGPVESTFGGDSSRRNTHLNYQIKQ